MDGYTLRLQRMDRKIKLFICVTLYNEDYDELRKTLVGICDVSAARIGCLPALLLPPHRALPFDPPSPAAAHIDWSRIMQPTAILHSFLSSPLLPRSCRTWR